MVELLEDVSVCLERNAHNRTEAEIHKVRNKCLQQCDFSAFLNTCV